MKKPTILQETSFFDVEPEDVKLLENIPERIEALYQIVKELSLTERKKIAKLRASEDFEEWKAAGYGALEVAEKYSWESDWREALQILKSHQKTVWNDLWAGLADAVISIVIYPAVEAREYPENQWNLLSGPVRKTIPDFKKLLSRNFMKETDIS